MSIKMRVAVPVGILVLAAGGLLGYLVCPKDYWPNNYPRQGEAGYKTKLVEIVNDALEAIKSTDPNDPNHDQILQQATDIVLSVLNCASQDLPNHSDDFKAAHAAAVDLAWNHAKKGEWKECLDALEGAGVNHPH